MSCSILSVLRTCLYDKFQWNKYYSISRGAVVLWTPSRPPPFMSPPFTTPRLPQRSQERWIDLEETDSLFFFFLIEMQFFDFMLPRFQCMFSHLAPTWCFILFLSVFPRVLSLDKFSFSQHMNKSLLQNIHSPICWWHITVFMEQGCCNS